ncbi:MAG: hypothetical protein LLG40_10555 [Deltaproteobacteria bacterium]|nr:hypothetical protein [Deltaproteobacteria bacterium]
MTDASVQALSVLRITDNMQWYIIPLLVSVFYVYFVEIEKRNWSPVLLGLAFWAGEFIWEMFNALILHFTNYAPLWTTPGKSAFVIYAGLNIEISFFFAVYGLMVLKILPEDKKMKIMGIPNRIFIPVILGLCGLFVEVLLNKSNMLIWSYNFWNWPNVYLIAVAYCLPMLVLVWLHDTLSLRAKKIGLVLVSVLAVVCHIVFASILGWV